MPSTKYWYAVPANSAIAPAASGWTMFSHESAPERAQRKPASSRARIASAAGGRAERQEGGEQPDRERRDQDRGDARTATTRGPDEAVGQDAVRHARVQLDPGHADRSPNGVLKTSTRPDAVNPMKTILSLNSAGSTIGFSPASSCCSDMNRRRNAYEGYGPHARRRKTAPAHGS